MECPRETKDELWTQLRALSAEEFREHLRSLIKPTGRWGLNQKQLAEKMGFSPQYISDVLKGRREPSEELARAIGFKRIFLYVRAKGKQ